MNRPIKFRAWDSEEKEWLENFMVSAPTGHLFIDTGKEWVTPADPDRFKLCQFTGLTDRNGVEICEGDIVKERYFPLGTRKDVIEYYNLLEVLPWRNVKHKIEGTKVLDESKALSHHKTKSKRHRHPRAGFDWISDLNIYGLKNMEVIGSIHEHPALLEEG